jgi:hypothetical protein
MAVIPSAAGGSKEKFTATGVIYSYTLLSSAYFEFEVLAEEFIADF